MKEDRGPRGRAARPRDGLMDKVISELQSISAFNGPWVTGSCWRQRPKLLMIGDERLRLLDTGTLSVPLGNAGRCAFFLSLLPTSTHTHAEDRWAGDLRSPQSVHSGIYPVQGRHSKMPSFSLVPQPGIVPVPPAVEAQSLNCWTTREVPE